MNATVIIGAKIVLIWILCSLPVGIFIGSIIRRFGAASPDER